MSVEAQPWALYGTGNIGQELLYQVAKPGVADRLGLLPHPEFIVSRRSGIRTHEGDFFDGDRESVNNVFVAIPSDADGETAMEIMRPVLARQGRVITAEKGGIANHFRELATASDDFERLGVNATVGGGTRMMEAAGLYLGDPSNVTQIHMAINGTLTAIMNEVGPQVGAGMSIGQAVGQAVRLGFAEPGAETPGAVLAGEAQGDLPKKTAIFLNKLDLVGRTVDWKELIFKMNPEDIRRVEEEARVRRAIVSLYHTSVANVGPESDIIGGFDEQIDGWQVVAGFRDVTRHPLFSDFAGLTGQGNGLVIGLGPDESDGVIRLMGQGAGAPPTVNTMLDDWNAIRPKA